MKTPENLYVYFDSKPEDFGKKKDSSKLIIYGILALLSIFLLINPQIIPFSSILIRIVAALALVYCLLNLLNHSYYFSKKSGGRIKRTAIKKFNAEYSTLEQIVEALHNKDFAFLSTAPGAQNNPTQLYIYHDEIGKEFYCQVLHYYSSSDFRGASEVTVISEPEYSILKTTVLSIK